MNMRYKSKSEIRIIRESPSNFWMNTHENENENDFFMLFLDLDKRMGGLYTSQLTFIIKQKGKFIV